MIATRSITVDEFEALGYEDGFELIRGELREVPPMGMQHGAVGAEFLMRIGMFVRERKLGWVFISDTRFTLLAGNPPTIVKPDVSFVRTDRLPPPDQRRRMARIPPDLAVEVRSPTDEPADIAEKIALYREAGVPLIWYCEPDRRTVTVHRPGREPVVLAADDELDGEDVLPGFRLRVADLFTETDVFAE